MEERKGEIYGVTEFTRKNKKSKVKKSFSVVLNGLMIGTVLASTFAGPMVQANAVSGPLPDLDEGGETKIQASTLSNYQDESGYLINLQQITSILQDSIKESTVQASTYRSLLQSVTAIQTYLATSDKSPSQELISSVEITTEVVKKDYKLHDQETNEARKNAINALNELRGSIGLDTDTVEAEAKVTQVASTKKINYKVKVGSRTYSSSGVAYKYGSKYYADIMVSKYAGAKVTYTSKTKTFTVTKGTKKVTIKKGSQYAYANGKKVKLKGVSKASGSKLHVTHDFFKLVTGKSATVSTSKKTVTVNYTVSKPTVNKPSSHKGTPVRAVGGKTVYAKYGTNIYGSKNQKEYDYTIKKTAEYLKKHNPKKHTYDIFKDGSASKVTEDMWFIAKNPDFKYEEVTGPQRPFYTQIKSYTEVGQVIDGVKRMNNDMSRVEVVEEFLVADYNLRFEISFGAELVTNKISLTSAYELMLKKEYDCDGLAHTKQVMYDMMGYKTKISKGPTHADLFVMIQGKWRLVQGNNIMA